MARYAILTQIGTPHVVFRVARRTLTLPGRLPIRDWVKQPCDEYGQPTYQQPSFLIGSMARSVTMVEKELLNRVGSGITLLKWVEL